MVHKIEILYEANAANPLLKSQLKLKNIDFFQDFWDTRNSTSQSKAKLNTSLNKAIFLNLTIISKTSTKNQHTTNFKDPLHWGVFTPFFSRLAKRFP